MTPVDLIIPDADPLISLAHADRLDLINVFNRPVAVLDIVRVECLRKPSSPDHPLLRAWFASNANAIRLVYEQALRDEAAGVNRHATRGLGDAAFGWLLPNFQTVVTRGTVPLVLTEDRNLSLTLADHQVVHILSNRAWLVGLQNAGVIASAAAVIRQIERHVRMLSTLQTDAPAHVDGYASDWIDKAS